MSSTPNEGGGFIEVLDSMTNIGPILDMSVVDLDKQGRDVVRNTHIATIDFLYSFDHVLMTDSRFTIKKRKKLAAKPNPHYCVY